MSERENPLQSPELYQETELSKTTIRMLNNLNNLDSVLPSNRFPNLKGKKREGGHGVGNSYNKV